MSEIFNYLLEYSFAVADKQTDMILEQIDLLSTFPRLGRMVPDYENERLRELVVGDYVVAYYLVSDDQIDILAIRRSSWISKK